MKLTDLDQTIKRVLVMAHAVDRNPSLENLDRLRLALERYDERFKEERAANLFRALGAFLAEDAGESEAGNQ